MSSGASHSVVTGLANRYLICEELAALIDRRVRLRDEVLLLVHGREVLDIAAHFAVLHPAVGGLEKTVLIHAGIDCKRHNQPDIRTFGGFDRAHPAVVRIVNVPDLESGTIARKTSGSERVQPSLVRELGKGIDLVHELRKLAGTEKLLDRRDYRLDGNRDPAA